MGLAQRNITSLSTLFRFFCGQFGEKLDRETREYLCFIVTNEWKVCTT
jgi:hypothetical protein